MAMLVMGCVAGGAELAPNLLKNGSFEDAAPDDPTLPAGWSRWQATRDTAYRDLTQARVGKAAMVVKNDVNGDWRVIQQEIQSTPDTYYQISFQGKTQGQIKGALSLIISGRAEAINHNFAGETWHKSAYVFPSSAKSNGTICVRFMPTPASIPGGIWVDDVVVSPITTTDQVSRLIEDKVLEAATAEKILKGFLARAAADDAKPIPVGIYRRNGGVYGAQGLYEALGAQKNIKAEYIDNFGPENLVREMVILIPSWGEGGGAPADWCSRLRAFVLSGGGLICFHNSVGYNGPLVDPLFPEIAKCAGKYFVSRPFQVKDPAHPVFKGLPAAIECAYGDYITMSAGAAGQVLSEDSEGRAVVVAGISGRGRVLQIAFATGLAEGNKELPPQGNELGLLLNSIQWVSAGRAVDPEHAKVLLFREKMKADVSRDRKATLFQITSAGNEIETMLDIAGFDAEEIKGKISGAEYEAYQRQIADARHAIPARLDDFGKRCAEPFDALLKKADLPVERTAKEWENLRLEAQALPHPKYAVDEFDVTTSAARQERYLPPIKEFKDKLQAETSPFCSKLAVLRKELPVTSKPYGDPKAWLENTFLLDMFDDGFLVPGRVETLRYLGHYGFNVIENQYDFRRQSPENLHATLSDMEPEMRRYGIRMLYWPQGDNEVGKPPAMPYFIDPAMLVWRKKVEDCLIKQGAKYPSFVGVQLDEVLSDDHYAFYNLQPGNISAENRKKMVGPFRNYLKNKYDNARLAALGLGALNEIDLPTSKDREAHQVLWMEYQDFLSDGHAAYWRELYEYLHGVKEDVVVWRLINRARFIGIPFACRWSRLSACADVVACSIWVGGDPVQSFFLELLRANARGPSVFTSALHQGGNVETYRRALAMSCAHAQGNQFFAWWTTFKQGWGDRDARLCGDRAAIWAATIEHTQRAKQMNTYLVKTASVAETALIYSERSANLEDYSVPCSYGPYFSNQFGLYAALAHAHIQCDPIYADGLKAETLKRYKVLLLSDAGSLEPEALALIRAWVAGGGYLIATGGSSLLDVWGRHQKDYRLGDVLGVKYVQTKKTKGNLSFGKAPDQTLCKADAYDLVEPTTGTVKAKWENGEPAVLFNRNGKGGCLFISAYHPGLSLTSTGMKIRSPFARDIKFFKGIKEFLADSVQEGLALTKSELPFTVKNCPEDVEVTMRLQANPSRKILHFINHSLTNVPVKGIELELPLQGTGAGPKRVFYGNDQQPVETFSRNDTLICRIRNLEVYEMIVLE
ncbi:MAG: beta-galactosidase trimerization domain-containing protein [Kiritimatiellae bacterium]|nr:beta-galactosidase trimerization domain-containing protein [Kiritimatiellia bacterium]